MSFTPTATAPFIELQRVESTNNYATGLVHAGMAQHGAAVFAHHQTAGKGQRNNQWLGEANQNIALSLILKPDGYSISQSFMFSMAIAVGTHRLITKYVGDEVKIKWPNDIYWRDRKTGGILLENIVRGSNWNWCIAGVGINVNQTGFDGLKSKAVSLKQITGKTFTPLNLAKELHQYLVEAIKELKKSEAVSVATYKQHLYKKNEAVAFKQGNRTFIALVKDVSRCGQLIVGTDKEERFSVGEVEWII